MELAEKLHRVADHYGEELQLIKLLEETAEVSDVVAKFLIAKKNGDIPLVELFKLKERLIEEMADAKNMMNQIAYLLKSEDLLEKYCNEKMDRQLGRING